MEFPFFFQKQSAKTFLSYLQTKAQFRNPNFVVFYSSLGWSFYQLIFIQKCSCSYWHNQSILNTCELIHFTHISSFKRISRVTDFLFKEKIISSWPKALSSSSQPQSPASICNCLFKIPSQSVFRLQFCLIIWQTTSHISPRYILGIPGLLGFWFSEETTGLKTSVLHKDHIDLSLMFNYSL